MDRPLADQSHLAFLAGGGEMGSRMRAMDWSATALGAPESWPQSLRSTISMLLPSKAQIVLFWGPEFIVLYNDAYRPVFGAKHPNALGQPGRQAWREIWDAQLHPLLEGVVDTGEAFWASDLLFRLERYGFVEETYFDVSYDPVRDESGSVGGVFCIVTETTARVVGQRRLALLRDLAARNATARTAHDACVLAVDALEGHPDDITFALAYLDDALQDATADAERLLAEASPAHVRTLSISSSGGHAGRLVVGLNPRLPFDDDYASFLNLVADQFAIALTNARAYEQERQRAEALAALDRAKTAFFSNVSHELRTPLTLMLGPLDEMRTAARDPETREQAALIHRNAVRLSRLVNTLLDFSRLEAGRARAAYQPTDLGRFTEDIVSVFRSATDRAGLRLTVTIVPLDQPVYVDRDMWEKIVLNLVSNAVKYTFAGGIDVSLAPAGRHVELRVADTGTGIAAEELPRLFERFHRVEGARGRTNEGTGIGLAMVQEVVSLHGGTVSVESEVDRGTVFIVRIPFGHTHLPSERVQDSESGYLATARRDAYAEEALQWVPRDGTREAQAAADADAAPVDARGRVVLADDNADMRDYLTRLLQSRWRVETVKNGREAFDAIRRERPDVLVTDVMMPELDGFGLLQLVRSDPTLHDLPVIMLSARAGDEATLDGVRAGADDYLVKPFSARDLVARIDAQVLRGRVRAIEEAHARRQSTTFAQAPVAIALLRGPDHVYELANPRYLDLIGHRDIVGRPIREALPELAGQGIYELLDRVRATGEPHIGRGMRITLVRAENQPPDESFFDFVYQPIIDSAGQVDSIAVVVTDVTEATRARREAEIANRAKDEFLAMLGHELRNPLAPILTALQLMRLRGATSVERERAVIERQTRHLVSLVNDLLDVSRITRGKVQLRRARVEITDAVAKAVETASPLIEQKSHTVLLDVAQDAAVFGDLDRLSQVVANLLTNAAKYTEDGGQIRVTGRRDGDRVTISVRDTGIGIAPEMLPRIFDLFVQERQALDRSEGGLGLGLAIVRSLVELHGGTVEAKSEGVHTGAEFIVSLPAAPAEDVPKSQPDLESPLAIVPDARRRVLIVDDNRDAADLLADALRLHGHLVATAVDGVSALRIAEEFRPDVALLDIGLPVMDGYELARRFAEHPRLHSTRLLAVTGYGQARDHERSTTAGFAAHLVKPLDLEELRQLLAAIPIHHTSSGDAADDALSPFNA